MSKPNSKLIKFIKEARKRGFDDYQIKQPLLNHGWPIDEIEKAFSVLKPRYKFKNKICLYLDSDVLRILDRRAKKNLFTISEQIDDILRRSCLSAKGKTKPDEKLDDTLIALFSRKRK